MDVALASLIDHTALAAEVGERDIERLCAEATEYKFAAVCVNPVWVTLAHSIVAATDVAVCTVIGFPLGASKTSCKVCETKTALEEGAVEFDVVMNIGAFLSGRDQLVKDDLRAVVEAAQGHPVKVIIETCTLDTEQIKHACDLVMVSGAAFVKTSTGMHRSGANPRTVALIRDIVGPDFGVKASGGIRNHQQAVAMRDAGANRLGASASVQIMLA
jgi:deoxyribose-phosphate aldolase